MTTSNGLLLLDKPKGLTSHDVVARVRKILDERRVGHAGTLDPMATGLLVLGVGPSTRMLRFAQSEVKRYSGSVHLGVATDSLDADGAVVDEQPVPSMSRDEMNFVVTQMLGVQWQVPPMVSAIKVGGQRLHVLARQGVEVEREPREITISEFSLRPTDDPASWDFEVECTVGTYVRVLLSDLARRVGTVGHLSALRRISSGAHHVEQACTLEQFEMEARAGVSPLRPAADFVTHLEHSVLGDDDERRMRMGQQLELAGAFLTCEIAALDSRGVLLGILRRRGERWQPEVVLPVEPNGAQG